MIAIFELAGKDSIAAAIKYLNDEKNRDTKVLASVVITPPEEESFRNQMNDAIVPGLCPMVYTKFIDYMYKYHRDNVNSRTYPICSTFKSDYAAKLWWEINRPTRQLVEEYGFYTPCIACHAICHAVRYELAKRYVDDVVIVSGERTSHNNRVKINQNEVVLNLFNDYFNNYMFKDTCKTVTIVRPVDGLSTAEIDALVQPFYNEFEVDNNYKYITCSMSGNYPIAPDEVELHKDKLERYCKEYLFPKLEAYINGDLR